MFYRYISFSFSFAFAFKRSSSSKECAAMIKTAHNEFGKSFPFYCLANDCKSCDFDWIKSGTIRIKRRPHKNSIIKMYLQPLFRLLACSTRFISLTVQLNRKKLHSEKGFRCDSLMGTITVKRREASLSLGSSIKDVTFLLAVNLITPPWHLARFSTWENTQQFQLETFNCSSVSTWFVHWTLDSLKLKSIESQWTFEPSS